MSSSYAKTVPINILIYINGGPPISTMYIRLNGVDRMISARRSV